MLEAFKEEKIVRKVGGRFRLTSLVQKRLVALKRGARPLVDPGTKTQMEIVVEEILSDKIFLDEPGEVVVTAEDNAIDGAVVDDAGPSLDDI